MAKFSEEAYSERIRSLFLRFQSVQKSGFNGNSFKSGLDGIRRFDETLGHPHESYSTVHVAGTNGKGSVCSMLASNFAACGIKTGLYTSPHLTDFRERMKVIEDDGCTMISREEVWEFLELYGDEMEGLSFFEITTGMALWWFRKQGVGIAVIETGLGGRLDSTNIITPVLSIVTSIGLDHCDILGHSYAEIAFQKGGIFKKRVPALVWGRDIGTDAVFEECAAQAGCPLYFADEGTSDMNSFVEGGMDLSGDCQRINVRTVLKALEILGEEFPLHEKAIREAARRTGFRGRWEKLCGSPLILCDIGHNPQALKINFSQLESLGRRMLIVYGIMADKDLGAIIRLMPRKASYYLCAPETPRAMSASMLQDKMRELRPELATEVFDSVREAVEKARNDAGRDSVVYIGGSTFVVSEAVELFR